MGKIEEGMVLVQAGEFIMGSDYEEASELSRGVDIFLDEEIVFDESKRKVYVDAFYIDIYPVTNARYKKFIEATGYPAPYVNEDWARPYSWENDVYPRGKDDHPVVLVTWEDAQAYVEWAGKRLPTEEEWEKTARGTDGRYWPWGNNWDKDLANSWEYGPRTTTPVAAYPKGVSPYGCYDMAGNVWEWVEEEGIIRGGSWGSFAACVRCTSRGEIIPTYRAAYIGFRSAKSAE